MIDAIDHMLANDVLQFFQIDHHAGFGIDLAADAHLHRVIVPMTAGVIAFVIGAAIPLGIELRIVKTMGRGECEPGGDDHGQSVTPASALRTSFCCATSLSRRPWKSASLCRYAKSGFERM